MTDGRVAALISYLTEQPDVVDVTMYGSFATGTADALSDLDLCVTVQGNNGAFLLSLPKVLSGFTPVLFADYAPSLAPEKYVLTACLWPDTPFLLVDFSLVAEPHCPTVTMGMLHAQNDPDTHLCKLFCANLKHYLRESAHASAGEEMVCSRDIRKMWRKLHEKAPQPPDVPEPEMLRVTYAVLRERCPAYREWLDGFVPFLP